jgi:hypothetical protein
MLAGPSLGRGMTARPSPFTLPGMHADARRDGAEPAAFPPVYTLAALLADPELTRPPASIIPDFLYEGRVTLLSAREKVGKTTLAAHAVAELTRGGVFLGTHLAAARVLWLAIDEPLGDTVRRFGAQGADPAHLLICSQQVTIAAFRAMLDEHEPSVVVVDTLSDLWRGRVQNDRDSTEVGDFLRPFVTVIRERGVAMLLIYHTSKAGAEYRGSGALGAMVDAPLTLRRRGKHAPGLASGGVTSPDDDDDDAGDDDGRRLLLGATRWGRVRLRLRSDGERYELDGSTSDSVSDRLLAVIRSVPGQSGSALSVAVRARKSLVLGELRSLELRGLVEERKRGWWPIAAPVPEGRGVAPSGTGAGTDIRGDLTLLGVGNRAGTGPEPMGTGERELLSMISSHRDRYMTHDREPMSDALCEPGSPEEAALLARLAAEQASVIGDHHARSKIPTGPRPIAADG